MRTIPYGRDGPGPGGGVVRATAGTIATPTGCEVRRPPLSPGRQPPRAVQDSPGAIVTKSGVIFVGGNDMALSAFSARDGQELWRHVLPRQATATPMTYLDAEGRQVVIIATGRGEDTALVAFRLSGS